MVSLVSAGDVDRKVTCACCLGCGLRTSYPFAPLAAHSNVGLAVVM